MVNHQARLSRTFEALVDPTRRAILARLEREESASVSELAEPFAIKLPAVMKHLGVLEDAGVVAFATHPYRRIASLARRQSGGARHAGRRGWGT